MRIVLLAIAWLGLAAACGDRRAEEGPIALPVPTPSAPAADAPAPAPAPTPAPLAAGGDCVFAGALEEIAVRIDAATGRGTLERTSPGRNRASSAVASDHV